MSYGYNGKILHVDLTNGKFRVEEPGEAFYRKYMGGSALAMHYLLKEMPAGADPLGPDNVLVLALSVLTGAAISGQSRMTAAAKSPLTGAIGDSQGGGFFPAELKFAGFDAIVIKGKSEKPVYLWINDGNYELRDASHLWGKITGEAEAAIKEELGDDKIEVLQIGPAGEKGVRFAGIFSMSNRANGRTGMGAVMGSKNLKAVAVRGKKRPSGCRQSWAQQAGKMGCGKSGGFGYRRTGEIRYCRDNRCKSNLRHTAHLQLQQWRIRWLGADRWHHHVRYCPERSSRGQAGPPRARDTCYACTVRCKRVVEITEGPYQVDPHYGGPEYETTSTFGNYCAVDDLPAICKANEICNKYGMDTISCGATISWAFEAFNEGKLTLEDTDGLDLTWGNAESMVRLTEKIAKREGFRRPAGRRF